MAHRRPRAPWEHGGANLRARHLGPRTSNVGHAARRLGRSDRDRRKPMNAIQRNLTVNNPDPAVLAINTIRTLTIDAVQKANSGHPGAAMALAPLVYTLWNRIMRFDPADPIWPNRDRFVLSNGHASMLQWSILHLTGTVAVNANYETVGSPAVTLEEIKRFRQLDSKAPGHPEHHWVSCGETTTR